MIRSARCHVLMFSLIALIVGLAPATAPVQAQVVKPFKITGEGVGPFGLPLPGQEPREHWIVGEATHLGRHYGEGAVRTDAAVVDSQAGRITGEFGSGSPFVFVGARAIRPALRGGRRFVDSSSLFPQQA